MENHREHVLYTENKGEFWGNFEADLFPCILGSFRNMPVLPLPPACPDFPHPLVQRQVKPKAWIFCLSYIKQGIMYFFHCSHPEEPQFDPALHLTLSAPK